MGGNDTPPSREVLETPAEIPDNHVTDHDAAPVYANQPVEGARDEDSILTRSTQPFKPERVARIVKEVTIGEDLSDQQRTQVQEVIREFADCFALSMKEVNAIPGAVHKLNIPEGTKFQIKVPPRSYNPVQRAYLESKIDEMLEAGVIRQIHPRDVHFVAQTVLAQKAHEGQGLTIDELKHRVNDQCVTNNLPPEFELPPRPTKSENEAPQEQPPLKWRICQDFNGINKLTEIAPVPQGDTRAKQLRLSGHRYLHVFDFAAGFYGVRIHPDSQPYITFYVEGRGHFTYQRMPFGVTGGPAEFGHVTAECFHDLIAASVMELFVDDGGMAADTFEEGLKKLRTLLERVRREEMSLSPSKMRLFMSKAVFTGAQVGPEGVSPDTAKLTAIVDWPVPSDASHLEGFLGLTSYFRDLMKGYTSIEGPLRNLLKEVPIPAGTKKHAYQRIMKGYKFGEKWTANHTKTFLALKAKLVSELVLSAPCYDGTPFILTTDGCIDAFAGVLSQRITTTLPGGKVVRCLHPIAFASKRTSEAESRYKPFLLEFAALKFAFDKFSDIIYGYPVEVETDCQALRDILLSDKLTATHARWRDGVLAHNIVDVRHVPGVMNIADGLSRQHEGQPHNDTDGSTWTVSLDWEGSEGLVLGVHQVSVSKETEDLITRFTNEPMFRTVVEALELINGEASVREKKRARHQASEYMIEEGKLWHVGGGTKARAKARRECVTQEEATELAKKEHEQGGHWHRDGIKIALSDKIHSPKLDQSIVKAIMSCARCKGFGGTHLNALLQPITRRHPFELLVGDYLSLPVGKGGYHTAGVYLDVFSQHVWGEKLKTAGSAKTTKKTMTRICHDFAPPEAFMSDGGSHFKNKEVQDFCDEWGIKHHVVAAYSPWINGLVEGTNRLLLYVLARLCAPEVGEDGWQSMSWEDLPKTWPDHFDRAIFILNWRILPALKFAPKELMLGMVVNTTNTPLEVSTSILTPENVDRHMTYAAQQRLDGYAEAVCHAIRRKATFDKQVKKSKTGEVIFTKGQLVQVFDSGLAKTLRTERKIEPMWKGPHRVRERILNSYKLETTEGVLLDGEFNARRLRPFEPREGTELAVLQEAYMEKLREEGQAEEVEETEDEEDNQAEEPENQQEGSSMPDSGEGEEEEESDEGDVISLGIGQRVSARRRGRRQKGGGNM